MSSFDDAVDLGVFVRRMEHRWVEVLGNAFDANLPESRNLRDAWRQRCVVSNASIARNLSGIKGKLQVLTPETGTGKTQGTMLYCGLLQDTIGALIVERTIEAAEEVARGINEAPGVDGVPQSGRAIAIHSELKPQPTLDAIAEYQAVVVTHAALEKSLGAFSLVKEMNGSVADQGIQAQARRWSSLTRWRHGERALVVIDELPQLISHASTTLQRLKEVEAMVKPSVWVQYSAAKRALRLLIKLFQAGEEEAAIKREQGLDVPNRLLWRMDSALGMFPNGTPDAELCVAAQEFFMETDLSAFRATLRKEGIHSHLLDRDPETLRKLRRNIGKAAEAMSEILQGFVHQSTRPGKEGSEEVFSSARLIVSEETPSAIILDATGRCSPIYPLRPDLIEVVERGAPCRRYHNVTLHVGRLKWLGKGSTKNLQATRIPQLVEALRASLTSRDEAYGGGILIVTHKDVIASVPEDPQWRVDYWGNLHGTNRHQHCHTIAFLSLPYRNPVTPELEYLATMGSQPDAWFTSEKARDDQSRMKVLGLGSEIVQAMNRGQCRRMVDGAGNCRKTHVYLLLPPGKVGDGILEIIREEMPGIREVPWDLRKVDGAKVKRPGKHDVRGFVLRTIDLMEPGPGFRKCELKQQIGCKDWWLWKVLKDVNDPNTDVGQAAARRGVVYMNGRLMRISAMRA